MQSISKFKKETRFLLCVIDTYTKYAWVIPLTVKKRIVITKAFRKFLDESGRKPKQLWVDKGIEVYNISMKS